MEHVTSHPSGSVRIVGGESVSLNETGSMDVDVDHHSMTGSSASYFTPLSGRLISASKDAIKRAIQVKTGNILLCANWPLLLVWPFIYRAAQLSRVDFSVQFGKNLLALKNCTLTKVKTIC